MVSKSTECSLEHSGLNLRKSTDAIKITTLPIRFKQDSHLITILRVSGIQLKSKSIYKEPRKLDKNLSGKVN
jgi:hypothetical protein